MVYIVRKEVDDSHFDDDLKEEVKPRVVTIRPKQTREVSPIAEGYTDCYWCSKVFKKDLMNKDKMHNTIVYICKGCQPK